MMDDATSTVVSVFGPPLLVAGMASLMYMMPTGALMLLTVWALLSVPVGIILGHCTLSGD